MTVVRVWTGREIRALREARRMSVQEFAEHLGIGLRTAAKWEAAGAAFRPRPASQAILDTSLSKAGSEAHARFALILTDNSLIAAEDDLDAVELERRVNASDVSDATLTRLEAAFHDAATRYAVTSPAALLTDLRHCLRYATQLTDAKATLRQRHRLLTIAGWFSLLAATLHVDLQNRRGAMARLATAKSLASTVSNTDLEAWCWETQAWNSLTDGSYDTALAEAEYARSLAAPNSSAHLQATAQAGRAQARMLDRRATAATLVNIEHLTAKLTNPATPVHHYQYDPGKTLSYTATTLAWAGDPAAAELAQYVLQRLTAVDPPRPRRVAAAQIDLALALTVHGALDESVFLARQAIRSGYLVPSNYWRVHEVGQALAAQGIHGIDDLAYPAAHE